MIHYSNIGENFLSKVVQVNENYLKLKAGYLFPEIAKRVKIYSQSNKSAEIIKLGIGDVTEPLPRACIEACLLYTSPSPRD